MPVRELGAQRYSCMIILDESSLAQAVAALADGQLVAIPTETVYGLAADAYDDVAVAKIYELKQRPQFNPLIAHVDGMQMAEQLVDFTPKARALTAAFWPGPLTIVLHRKAESQLSRLATAGLDTVAVRMPQHELARAIISKLGRPLVAPSANPSQTISPTSAQDVAAGFGEKAPIILDGGVCQVGLESTIIDMTCSTPTILRPGGVTMSQLQQILGEEVAMAQPNAAIKAPGMMRRHYAPGKPLRLNATSVEAGESLIGFGPSYPNANNLSVTGDLREAASNLFRLLRKLDGDQECQKIAVAPIPNDGLGAAINDRLYRAAAC